MNDWLEMTKPQTPKPWWLWQIAFKVTWGLSAIGIHWPHEWVWKRLWLTLGGKHGVFRAKVMRGD